MLFYVKTQICYGVECKLDIDFQDTANNAKCLLFSKDLFLAVTPDFYGLKSFSSIDCFFFFFFCPRPGGEGALMVLTVPLRVEMVTVVFRRLS